MSATPEVRYWQHVESGHVNMARLGGGPDGVAERDPIWREVTVSPVVTQGAATPAGATWHTDPPLGWSTFGAHALMDEVPALEFWGEEYGGDGLPIWERPVPAPDADVAERIVRAIEAERSNRIGEQEELRHYGRGVIHGLGSAARIARSHATPPVAATCPYRFPLPYWAGEDQMDRQRCALPSGHAREHATTPEDAAIDLPGFEGTHSALDALTTRKAKTDD